jgi:hypothetical protein
MSLNTKFENFLIEDNTNYTIPSPGNVLTGLDTSEQEALLRHINSVLVGIVDAPSFNPYYQVERIKQRLRLALGLTFDDTYFLKEVGSFERVLVPVNNLNAATPAFRTTNVPTGPHIHAPGPGGDVIDNGYLNKFPHGLLLKVQFLRSDNLWHLNAQIVPAPDAPALPTL